MVSPFDREHEPAPIISFDLVNEGRRVTSQCPIFRLPSELHDDITRYLLVEDIAALALVDRDCRQLARTIQFSDICFDYSSVTFDLLAHLGEEARDRLANNGVPSRPTIGACVRRVTLDIDQRWVKYYRASRLGSNDFHVKWRDYVESIGLVLSSAMPNLHTFIWKNRVQAIPRYVMYSLLAVPLRHLSLEYVHWEEPDGLDDVTLEQCKWALETLQIGIARRLDTPELKHCIPIFIHSILRLAAPTLHTIQWNGMYEHLELPNPGMFHRWGGPGLPVIYFPKLRHLTLTDVQCADDSVISALIDSPVLRSLRICSSPQIFRYLSQRGCIPSLESFASNFQLPAGFQFAPAFLRQNQHLQTVGTYGVLDSAVNNGLLASLSCFRFLTTLRLTWQGISIPLASLHVIGTITSLTALWLSAGRQEGRRLSWEIDHLTMTSALRRLCLLERLAFSGDTYSVSDTGSNLTEQERRNAAELYYFTTSLPRGVNLQDFLVEEDYVELGHDVYGEDHEFFISRARYRWHRFSMMEYAMEYFRSFPMLQGLHFGRLYFIAAPTEDHSHREVELATEMYTTASVTLFSDSWFNYSTPRRI